jgi:plastocyanin
MTMRRLVLLATLALLGGILVGCGGPAATAAGPVHTDRVDLPASYRFEPTLIQVVAGTTVTWTNADNFTHAVQVQDGEVHDLPIGQSTSITFDAPGTYDYVCPYHPQDMKGTVIVTGS